MNEPTSDPEFATPDHVWTFSRAWFRDDVAVGARVPHPFKRGVFFSVVSVNDKTLTAKKL